MDKPTNKEQGEQWYALTALYRKEIAVRDELLSLGFQTYVPMKCDVARKNGQRQRVLRPAISGLLFAKGTVKSLFEFKHGSANNPYIFFRSKPSPTGYGWQPIVVSDTAMNNFMQLCEVANTKLKFFKPEELRLAPGQEVKIMDGVFKDVVGRIQKLPHRAGDYLVVEIEGVTTVAARIKPDFVQPLGQKVARSADVDGDVKRLDQTACQLLYEVEAGTADTPARGVLISQLDMLRRSLCGCKLYMPSDRAAYALAHLLAAQALGEPADTHADTLRSVVPKMRTSSLTRLRACLYLSLCCHDSEAAATVDDTLVHWGTGARRELYNKFMAEKRMAEKRWGGRP